MKISLTDLKIDLSTFRTPIVTWEEDMFVPMDAIYTNYPGALQTEEGVFFTGTVFYPYGPWLHEYENGYPHGRHVFFLDDGTPYQEKIYIEDYGFVACIDGDGKLIKGYIFEKEAFLAWLDTDGKMLKDKCFKANGFEDKKP
jgi:hypothetical protein